jgi:UPF0176 protein
MLESPELLVVIEPRPTSRPSPSKPRTMKGAHPPNHTPEIRRPSEFAHPVILFYKYVPIAGPERFAAEQLALCNRLGLKGRVLVAEEGINGTLAGPGDAVDAYVTALQADPRFADIEVKFSAGDPVTFPRLSIKARPEIVTLGATVPLKADQDNHLSPAEWRSKIEQDPDILLVDVRNRYESAAGKFEGALACDIEYFRELPAYMEKLGQHRDKTILMYCTGGIRCEKASALFRHHGFEKVFQLHGGIVNYQREFGNEHWLGECFVFDNRMTVKVDENLVPIGRCAHSGRSTNRFINCLHDPCHSLFLLAPETEKENPETRLCPECIAQGFTSRTADYKGSPSRSKQADKG